MDVFQLEGYVMLVAIVVLLAVKVFAFVLAIGYSGEAYQAAGKMTKAAWCILLGLGVATAIVLIGSPIGIINLVFTIVAFVFLADVRPAITDLTRR